MNRRFHVTAPKIRINRQWSCDFLVSPNDDHELFKFSKWKQVKLVANQLPILSECRGRWWIRTLMIRYDLKHVKSVERYWKSDKFLLSLLSHFQIIRELKMLSLSLFSLLLSRMFDNWIWRMKNGKFSGQIYPEVQRAKLRSFKMKNINFLRFASKILRIHVIYRLIAVLRIRCCEKCSSTQTKWNFTNFCFGSIHRWCF